MRDNFLSYNLRDNGGRRTRIERRRFSYAQHIPERRAGEDRRLSTDRRCGDERRGEKDRRRGIERRAYWRITKALKKSKSRAHRRDEKEKTAPRPYPPDSPHD